jgi:tRNA/tmRNA/rRNA uracil-C5-methylase (TrmA/RlmC/RlmD family)
MRLSIGSVAHGGYCVARHEGQVVFVRGTLPGEVVEATVTRAGRRNRFLFADATEILEPAAGRVPAPCPFSGPGRCGGCDWQHADLPTQRQLKAAVLAEQLQRLGGVTVPVEVAPVQGDRDGLQWRTAVRYAVTEDGRLGFRKHHSHEVEPIDRCAIATARIQDADVTTLDWTGAAEVAVTEDGDGVMMLPDPDAAEEAWLQRGAYGRTWRVPSSGFWQVHPGAADALADLVVEAIAGCRTVWDLYCGVGLFAGAAAVDDPGRRVEAVESHRPAVTAARANVADLPGVQVHRADVLRWLTSDAAGRGRPDAVILDPPRKGAGERVLSAIDAVGCRRIVYVACDPSALGRDVGLLRARGYDLDSVVALDLFPMTHHVEAVAVLSRGPAPRLD